MGTGLSVVRRWVGLSVRFDGEPDFVTVFHRSRFTPWRPPLAIRGQRGVVVPDLIAIHDHPLVEHRRYIGVGLPYRERIGVAVEDDRVSACYPTQELVAGDRRRRGNGREEAPAARGTQKVPKYRSAGRVGRPKSSWSSLRSPTIVSAAIAAETRTSRRRSRTRRRARSLTAVVPPSSSLSRLE